MMNPRKQQVLARLQQIGPIDTFGSPSVLAQFPNIRNVTCYYGKEILQLYSQYKFVVNFENSETNGYITEKIFNVFASGSIPIYHGAPDIEEYANADSFVHCNGDLDQIIRKVQHLNSNKHAYEAMASSAIKVLGNPRYAITQTYLDD